MKDNTKLEKYIDKELKNKPLLRLQVWWESKKINILVKIYNWIEKQF